MAGLSPKSPLSSMYQMAAFAGHLHYPTRNYSGLNQTACHGLGNSIWKGDAMIDVRAVAKMAADYTAAWNSKSPEAVASFYAEDGEIIINNGDPWSGRSRVKDMAAGFYADVPDLTLTCDDVRCAGTHVIFVWTFTGHDASSGNPLNIQGWEEWEIGDDLKVKASRGWFDAVDYGRQAEGK